MKTGRNREYEVMTKEHYNSLIGQKRLWVAGEREALLDALCTRDGKLMTITTLTLTKPEPEPEPEPQP